MKIKEKLSEIRKFCQTNADQAIVKKYARFFVEGYDAYGVDPKLLEKQGALWIQKFGKELNVEDFLKLGDLLIQRGKHEEGNLAIWFAAAFKSRYTAATLDRFGCWLEDGIRNWAHCDFLCGEILWQFISRKLVTLEALADWRDSHSKWKRRAVPVTLLAALRMDTPVPSLLQFISPMMLDPEKVVRQGLGWFLREAWKKTPVPVEAFLIRWKDTCGRLIIQYATEKMSPSQKAKFRKEKIRG
jgi:3-methyladenine DNA glycosylase AlkD